MHRGSNSLEGAFLESDWVRELGCFDAVVSMQTVHELRHKRRAPTLHRQVRSVLRPGGAYLVGDHYSGGDGMANVELYMSVEEQALALEVAGFVDISVALVKGGLV